MEEWLANVPRFDVMTGRLDFFSDTNKSRGLAMHVHSGRQLKILAAICEEASLLNSFHQERRSFQLHITLARLKHHRHFLDYSMAKAAEFQIKTAKSFSTETHDLPLSLIVEFCQTDML